MSNEEYEIRRAEDALKAAKNSGKATSREMADLQETYNKAVAKYNAAHEGQSTTFHRKY